MINVIVAGAAGRMGCRLVALIKDSTTLTLAGAIEGKGHPAVGDDALTLPMMAVGGKGVISVTSNIVPFEMAQLVKAFLIGHIEEARRIHFALSPLFTALFYETNPIPVKTALGMMGKIDPELRLPLCAMATETKDQLAQVLKDAGLV